MADSARCSGCGAEFVAEASPQGLCPACLLKLGLSDPDIRVERAEASVSTEPAGAPTTAAPPRSAKPSLPEKSRFPRPSWPVLAVAGGAVVLVALTAFVVSLLHPHPDAPDSRRL